MPGRVALVTGANRGIGKEIARQLAAAGDEVVMLGRDAAALTKARDEVASAAPGARVSILVCDLRSQASVKRACEELRTRVARLDLLIHNAVVIRGKRNVTVDGIEETLAVAHIAPYMMTNLLLPLLRATPGARIVQVGTGAFPKSVNWDDLQVETKYSAFPAYMQAKMVNLAWALDAGRRLAGTGVTLNAIVPHPFVRTEGIRELPLGFRIFLALVGPFKISAEEAARRVLHVATAPELASVSGEFFAKGRAGAEPKLARDPEVVRRAREVSEKLTGIPSV